MSVLSTSISVRMVAVLTQRKASAANVRTASAIMKSARDAKVWRIK